MKLVVVAGYREYLAPTPIPREQMLRVLRRIEPDAYLPDYGWAEGSADSVFPAIDLALEYATDTTPSNSTAFVVLPFESCCDGRSDNRVLAFLDAARKALGSHAVRSIDLCLSRNTQAVLERLGATQSRPGASIEVAPLFGDSILDRETLATFQRNYTEAVLERGEAIVGNRALFTGTGRAAVVSRCLDENRLLLRPDLTPERVLAELQPGGELFELLCRPLARPAEGGTLSSP